MIPSIIFKSAVKAGKAHMAKGASKAASIAKKGASKAKFHAGTLGESAKFSATKASKFAGKKLPKTTKKGKKYINATKDAFKTFATTKSGKHIGNYRATYASGATALGYEATRKKKNA